MQRQTRRSRSPKIILKNAIKVTDQIEPNQIKPKAKRRTTPIDMKLREARQEEKKKFHSFGIF